MSHENKSEIILVYFFFNYLIRRKRNDFGEISLSNKWTVLNYLYIEIRRDVIIYLLNRKWISRSERWYFAVMLTVRQQSFLITIIDPHCQSRTRFRHESRRKLISGPLRFKPAPLITTRSIHFARVTYRRTTGAGTWANRESVNEKLKLTGGGLSAVRRGVINYQSRELRAIARSYATLGNLFRIRHELCVLSRFHLVDTLRPARCKNLLCSFTVIAFFIRPAYYASCRSSARRSERAPADGISRSDEMEEATRAIIIIFHPQISPAVPRSPIEVGIRRHR